MLDDKENYLEVYETAFNSADRRFEQVSTEEILESDSDVFHLSDSYLVINSVSQGEVYVEAGEGLSWVEEDVVGSKPVSYSKDIYNCDEAVQSIKEVEEMFN